MPLSTGSLHNLQRDTLRKIQSSASASDIKKQLAALRIAYSEDSKLLTGYLNKLQHVNRIFPRFLPTQASGRTSTIDPPIPNWPRACIEPACQQRLRDTIYGEDHLGYIEHEWSEQCWSVRDILLPDNDEILITWDHDNIEGKIHDIIVNDQEAIQAHQDGLDLHTITCCNVFGYQYPPDLHNPHTKCTCGRHSISTTDNLDISRDMDTFNARFHKCIHCLWREKHKWRGKDGKDRNIAKQMNHGSKYTKTWRFVYRIKGIEQYGINYTDLDRLAKRYIESKGEAWERKLAIMDSIRRKQISRTLYGFRRIFFDSTDETAREGFSHMISGTVSDYNYITLDMLEKQYGAAIRMMHNAHDGDKMALHKDVYVGHEEEVHTFLKQSIERPLTYEGRTLTMTAGIKVHA